MVNAVSGALFILTVNFFSKFESFPFQNQKAEKSNDMLGKNCPDSSFPAQLNKPRAKTTNAKIK